VCHSGMDSRPRSLNSRSATGLPRAVLASVRPLAVSDLILDQPESLGYGIEGKATHSLKVSLDERSKVSDS
jgi:hypothetical protein